MGVVGVFFKIFIKKEPSHRKIVRRPFDFLQPLDFWTKNMYNGHII